jgi:hypothetical protein
MNDLKNDGKKDAGNFLLRAVTCLVVVVVGVPIGGYLLLWILFKLGAFEGFHGFNH